jgi:hypothetical protein
VIEEQAACAPEVTSAVKSIAVKPIDIAVLLSKQATVLMQLLCEQAAVLMQLLCDHAVVLLHEQTRMQQAVGENIVQSVVEL